MSLSRTFCVVVVSVVLLAVAVPAAQARTLDTSSRVLRPVDGSWLAASMSWFAQLFRIELQVPVAREKTGTVSPPTAKPMTGACIDPLGGIPIGGSGTGGSGGTGGGRCNT